MTLVSKNVKCNRCNTSRDWNRNQKEPVLEPKNRKNPGTGTGIRTSKLKKIINGTETGTLIVNALIWVSC